jgi:hypothetical protein
MAGIGRETYAHLLEGRFRMTRTIEVGRSGGNDPLEFEVTVREGNDESRHYVTISQAVCTRLGGGRHTPERCLEAAFRFLLDREPKESILRHFDLSVISRYFPEFERELPRYLAAG